MSLIVPIVLERDNVNDESVTLARWHVQHGQRVELDALLAEVETSKANMEVYAPASGYLLHAYPEGADVPVSAAIGGITSELVPIEGEAFSMKAPNVADPIVSNRNQSPEPDRTTGRKQWQDVKFPSNSYKQRISPVAARLMAEKLIPASVFAGLSVVRKQDVLDHLNPPAVDNNSTPATQAGVIAPRTPINLPYQQIPLSKMKRSEGANLAAGMTNAVASAITVTSFTRGLRQVLTAKLHGDNPAAVFIYEVARLLQKYPTLNATYSNGNMLQYEKVNIGFAMDDGRGLKVAAIPNSDQLSLQQIGTFLRDLTVAYLDNKLTIAQTSNITFTISDLSGLGVSSFMPLISENQGGILGIGSEQFAPGNEFGSFTMTLTFDHQLSNGRIAALFLNDLKERLQNYEHTHLQETPKQQARCSQCYRSALDLKLIQEYLLVSAEPEGYLCTLCAEGY